MTFDQLGLDPLILKAITEKGYTKPSPIQAQAIPAVLKGGDVMAAAQTGTGKTAGFTLPILHRLADGKRARDKQVRALILTPTRELAAQIFDNVQTYGKHLNLCTQMIFGGVGHTPQIRKLKLGADILIATPGRLLDLIEQKAMRFERLEILVLDEADRMLDMGFIRDIKKIISKLPKKRQNLLFSATFSESIRKLSRELIHNPTEISVNPENTTADTVTQWIHPVDKKQKPAALVELIKTHEWDQTLVFCRTKHSSNRLATFLEKKKISAAAIHGNKSQNARMKALNAFKAGKIKVLVATDIAARGIDISQLPQVVNFDLPEKAEDYVHRIGRTGRAGSEGQAISLVSAEELYYLVSIEQLIQRLLPRKKLAEFEAVDPLPEAPLGTRVPKPKKKASTNQRGGNRGPSQGRNTTRSPQTKKASNTKRARRKRSPHRPKK